MADYFVSLWCLRICCCISNRSIFSCRRSSLQGASFYVSVCVLQIKKLLVGPDRNPVPWSTLYLLLHKYSYTYIQHIRFLKMWLLWEYDGNLISDLIKCSYCIGTCTIGVQHAACLKSFRDEFKVNMLLLFPVDLTIDGRFKKNVSDLISDQISMLRRKTANHSWTKTEEERQSSLNFSASTRILRKQRKTVKASCVTQLLK